MKQKITIVAANGKPLEHWELSEREIPLHEAREGVFVHRGALAPDEYVKGGKVKQLPPKNHPYETFNYDSEVWEDRRNRVDAMATLRAERNKRLVECDWSQLPDVTQECREKYAEYRQALRDITDQPDAPFEVTWPEKPE